MIIIIVYVLRNYCVNVFCSASQVPPCNVKTMALLALALVLAPAVLSAPTTVERFGLFEGSLPLSAPAGTSPFAPLCNVTVRYTGAAPSRHPAMRLGTFYTGPSGGYKFRFSPDAVGSWEWESVCPAGNAAAAAAGKVECVASRNTGGMIAHGKDFAHEDGSPHLPVGIELDWLWALEIDEGIKTAPLEGFISHITSFGFNHALVNTFANWSNWNAADPINGGFPPRTMPRVSPTILSPWAADQRYSSDQSELSLPFFDHWDTVITTMARYNFTAHMMIYVGNKEVAWPTRGSDDDNTYWHYVLARYGAYSNIVLDISKEAGSYGTTVAYAQDRLRLTHALNPHKRLVTAHGPGGTSWPKDPARPNAKGVCPSPGLCDMLSLQEHTSAWSATSHYYYDWVIKTRDAHPDVPMVVVEFLYEAGPDRGCAGSCCGGCHQGCGMDSHNHGYQCPANATDSAAKRMIMWDIYMAGGYGTWYNCDTAWDVITMSTSAGYHAVKTLSSFWSGIDRSLMQPHDDLLKTAEHTIGHCLAAPGKDYIVHLHALTLGASSARTVLLEVTGVTATGVKAEWTDTTTGATTALSGNAVKNGANILVAPAGDADSYVLRVQIL